MTPITHTRWTITPSAVSNRSASRPQNELGLEAPYLKILNGEGSETTLLQITEVDVVQSHHVDPVRVLSTDPDQLLGVVFQLLFHHLEALKETQSQEMAVEPVVRLVGITGEAVDSAHG